MKTVKIRINGETVSHPVDDRLSLTDFSRSLPADGNARGL